MKINKNILIIAVVIIYMTIAIGIVIIVDNKRYKNVFDEMYLAVERVSLSKSSALWFLLYEATSPYRHYFMSMEGLDNLNGGGPDQYTRYYGIYDSDMLQPGEKIEVIFDVESQYVEYSAYIHIDDTYSVHYVYIYYPKTKTLMIESYVVARNEYGRLEMLDNLELAKFLYEYDKIIYNFIKQYRNYFLYDRILADWVTDNCGKSKFTTENYGEFTIIDSTFDRMS